MLSPRRLTIAATGLLLATALAACGTDDASTGQAGAGSTSSSTAAATSDRAADIAFAQLMIPHHQQALEMAQLATGKATTADVKRLAGQIEAAQDPEIRTMKGWLSAWDAPQQMPGATASGGSMDHSGHDMGGMSSQGMMTAEDMARLSAAGGDDFDSTWLEMMIRHHEGAITMADQVLTTTKDPEVTTLANAVRTGQRAEIDQMRQLLAR
ncbi:MAG TPA: DUF305 domain-containing protein [Dermatophilaceae bacterium]|nr:DUF305 domain-containing protein [Dermatophilaceae bacterium]